MKKALLINSAINISFWFFAYWFAAFVKWELTNPFQWLINIPNYSQCDRGLILFYFLFWQAVQIWVISMIIKEKNQKKP